MNIDRTTPLWDTTLPVEDRISWLLKNMTLEEKISWLPGWTPDIERLGVPGYGVGGEAAHGVQARNDQGERGTPQVTTSFVQPIGMSATWDPELIRKAGNVTGTEARILADENGNRGLSRWAPTVDLERDPRWGRNEEGYGEDPFLTGKMAGAYVNGIQGPDPDHLLAASTLKHFYGNNTERGRGWKSDSIDPRNKWESYLRTFIRVIHEGHPEGIMTAYNRINGIPGIMNPEVQTILKDSCGLQHAVSDGGAANVALSQARQKGTAAEIIAAAVKAGVDSMSDNPFMVIAGAREAIEDGLLTEADLDRAISNMMRTKIRLGLYDAQETKMQHPERELLLSEKHRKICRQVSREAMVLLKNDCRTLPLEKTHNVRYALIGPWADLWLQDWYGGMPDGRKTIRLALEQEYGLQCECFDGFDRITLHLNGKPVAISEDGMLRAATDQEPAVFVLEDWGNNNCLLRHDETGLYVAPRSAEEGGTEYLYADRKDAFDWFVRERIHFIPAGNGTYRILTRFELPAVLDADGRIAVGKETENGSEFNMNVVVDGLAESRRIISCCDEVIFTLGCHSMMNAKEEEDRTTLRLPERQEKLAELPEIGKGIAVLVSNYPYAIGAINERFSAVLWTASGAQDLGSVVAETLLGDNVPAGRLNMTWYRDDSQLSDMDEYDLVKGKKTYRYFPDTPLYPFGYGLTYTGFAYDMLKIKCNEEALQAEFTVCNTGKVIADEVVQLYWSATDPTVRCPLRQLAAFERIHDITPGETRKVCLKVPVSELAVFDPVRGEMVIRAGTYRIAVGASSADIRLEDVVTLKGEEPSVRNLSGRIFADSYDDYDQLSLIPGQHQKDAVTPLNGKGKLLFERCRRDTITERLLLRVYSEKAGTVDIRINGKHAGHWEGCTLDWHDEPIWFPDELTRSEETGRIAMQSPVWCDVLVSLKTDEQKDENTLADLEIELGGDVKLNWFRAYKVPEFRFKP